MNTNTMNTKTKSTKGEEDWLSALMDEDTRHHQRHHQEEDHQQSYQTPTHSKYSKEGTSGSRYTKDSKPKGTQSNPTGATVPVPTARTKTWTQQEVDEYVKDFDLVMFTDGACINSKNVPVKKGAKPARTGGLGVYIFSKTHTDIDQTRVVAKLPMDTIVRHPALLSMTVAMEVLEVSHSGQQPPADWLCQALGACTSLWTYSVSTGSLGDGTQAKTNSRTLMCSGCKPTASPQHEQVVEMEKRWVSYQPTNIRAEGLAMLTALKFSLCSSKKDVRGVAAQMNTRVHNTLEIQGTMERWNNVPASPAAFAGRKVIIITDSLFWIDLVTKWQNGWISKKTVFEKKNYDIIATINITLNKLSARGVKVDFKHVHGHQDEHLDQSQLNMFHKGNVLADKLANHGLEMADCLLHIS
jgi:ribonuclease HI